MISELNIQTKKATEFIDITDKVQQIVVEAGTKEGIIAVYIPHTTAGITINENADPDVQRDMLKELNKIIPFEDNYAHVEGNSAAHIKASLMGFSETVILHRGRLLLGTWQSIYFCEFDGPRHRKILLKIINT